MSQNYALCNITWYFKQYTSSIVLLMQFSVASFIIKSDDNILQ